MTSFSPDGPKLLLAELCRLVHDRSSSEVDIRNSTTIGKESADKNHQDALNASIARYQAKKKAAEDEFAAAKHDLAARFKEESGRVQKEYDSVRAQANAKFDADTAAAEQKLSDHRWEVMAMSEAARCGSNLQVEEIVAGLDSRWQELLSIHEQAVELLKHRGQWDNFPDPQIDAPILENHPAQRFTRALETARAQYRDLSRQIIARFFQKLWPLAIFFMLWALAALPTAAVIGWSDYWRWLAISGGTTIVLALIGGISLYNISNRRAAEAYLALRRTLLEAGLNRPSILETAKAQCQRFYGAISERQNAELKKIEEKIAAVKVEIARRKQRDLEQADKVYPPQLAELGEVHDRSLFQINEKYARLLHEIDLRYTAESERLRAEHAQAVRDNDERSRRLWAEMSERWLTGVERFSTGVEEVNRICRESFPDWNTSDWSRWTAPTEIPQAFPLGSGKLELVRIKGGLPVDEKLRPPQVEFDMPALLPFPKQSLLLWKAGGAGLAKAVDSMQAAMLRMLTAMPPGKVRFTIIDPVGLGENFSAFMHLADYDEQLVANRIWTDVSHIEQRLADLTKHMENVIQVYLRQEFHSIQEYNAFAGEMAEPYRVLVVANFPANISEVAAQRLKSIVASGARCGVFVLMSVDTNLPVSHHFHLPDLEPEALVLRWDGTQFLWEHKEYGPLPLALTSPPPAEKFREIVCTVGEQAKSAGRVEVPFDCIIPPKEEWWTADSRAGIDVPLGRAGAMKLQNLALGSGTSQHVLISGKTGSGKSTLLHVLITNLALRYSPDEVELYLVDFKKGVEFKAYAHYALPHAKVIAIESEREFGLSVLQRLDAELRTRGDMFRKQGVQDLKGYRNELPDAKLPRILLIIDEFQELFTEDDRIAQEATLLLDRLVRQGRAFGIHVLLGSQTLGGAYSLARTTLGQMAVRIALQCSESDAHLILSEDNTAARLLTRPGEAIYNDANGLYEGNHPFQIVWLNDSDRDHYLEEIETLMKRKNRPKPASIIFEGNIPANPSENPSLKELIAVGTWPESCSAPQAWLGAAVAIKDPTSAAFLRQNGSNLLIVGHREETALGVLANSLISFASQFPPGSENGEGKPENAKNDRVRFFVLDGIRADAPEAGYWNRLAQSLPHSVKIANPRVAAESLAEISAELEFRREHSREHESPIYLLIYNIARFRDLRKEDDFSFSSMDDGKPASPAKQFGNILREGPALGIHTLVWCDTYNNVSRFLDRQTLRDFEMRILFQMNATDSSNLMDTPDASRLGVHVAISYDEGQGRMEKFRPYGLPTPEWLADLKKLWPPG
jgi:energy-coupling factor transporter ATP-binding protein EcfA2/CRISPR/Cas system CSM-associated protein Csm2 small subunit